MFEKALAALDLSPAEEPLVDCLPALRAWSVKQLVLAHVIQVGYGQGAATARAAEIQDWLEQQAGPLRRAGFAVDTQVRASGSPADEILVAASECSAGLVVAGSRGQNRLSTLFLGSTARELVRTSPLPLLLEWIEPTAGTTGRHCKAVCTDPLRQVLLATDFSDLAAAAEQMVLALGASATQVSCVHVAAGEQEAARARPSMDALLAHFEAHGVRAGGTIEQGLPVAAITAHAARLDASLIVVGKRGQGRLASLLAGSTTTGVCEIAGRPVLIVP